MKRGYHETVRRINDRIFSSPWMDTVLFVYLVCGGITLLVIAFKALFR
jgi:hypothetical protein